MITNKDKIAKCSSSVINLVNFLEKEYGNVTVTSGYRSADENERVGGAKNSAHLKAVAVDIIIPNVSPIKVAAKVLENKTVHPILGLGLDLHNSMCHFDFMDRGVSIITYWAYDSNGRPV